MQQQIKQQIDRLKSQGVTYVDTRWYPLEEANYLTMISGNLKNAAASRESGMGIRVLYKGAWGFSASSDLGDLKGLYDKAFDNARIAAERVLGHQDELPRLEGACVDEVRELVLSIEGRAAHYYWQALEQVFPAEYAWPGRVGRDAQDAINAALNYGYGILYSQVERAIILAGLDPYAGYIHADRPGKPSLVYDLIEPFRAPVVDRTVVAMANRHMALHLDEGQRLDEESRRGLADQVLGRLERPEAYEGKRVPLRIIVQEEARRLTTYLRQERGMYDAFMVRW